MDYAKMTIEQMEERVMQIDAENLKSENEDIDRDALIEEMRSINEELENRKAAAVKAAEIRSLVANGIGTVIEERKEDTKVETIEIRNTVEYINAYANYIKSGKDTECRALLSTNGTDAEASLTGYVPVPDIVESTIKTAWERSDVLTLVRKTYMKGNVKVGFELSAGGAVVHKEGAAAPSEEVITLGIVTMVPQSIKKWITISDEALDLSGSEFLNYIYDELTYRIAKKAEEELVDIIAALPDTATSTSVSAATIEEAPSLTVIADAMAANVGSNQTILMNRGTFPYFRKAQVEGNFAADPFEGLKVIYTDALPSYTAANDGDVYMIVGDFYEGAQANFPAGEGIDIKVDNLSLAEKDLVKFVGREFVAFGAVADKRFTLVAVP